MEYFARRGGLPGSPAPRRASVRPAAAPRRVTYRRANSPRSGTRDVRRSLPVGVGPRSVASRNSTGESGNVAEISCQILRFDLEEARDDCRGLLPIAGFRLQLLAAGPGKPIEARTPIVLRDAPLG